MKRSDLKEQGLTEEQIEFVMKENGKDIEHYKDIETDRDALQKQLQEANETIEEFKELNVDEIKQAADDYKEKYEQAKEEAAENIKQIKFDHKLQEVLNTNKARNAKAVKALLDMDALEFDGEEIKGLEDQLKQVKEENDFLFDSEENKKPDVPRFLAPGGKENQKSSGIIDIGALADDASIRK